MFTRHFSPRASTVAGVAALWLVGVSPLLAQRGSWRPPQVVEAGARVAVRTTRPIDERTPSGRVYSAIVDRDVLDARGRLAIPTGAAVELIVRRGRNHDLFLDLESVNMNGQWYGVDAPGRVVPGQERVDSTIGNNKDTAERVGGGALIGSIVGAIVGGGKGAAIGAAAGAGIGASTQLQVHGEYVRVPAESLITFRLESPLRLGWRDNGRDRDGVHFHDRGN